MKVRKLAVALALAGGLGSGVAQALGLGEIELQSYLNEPLDADIELRKSAGVAPGEVFVNLAPDSAYERVGINRSYFLTKLNFQVTTAPDGNLVVNVSSREPLREPYLNFLVEVTWPNGRLMREYAVLVDPPVYAEESGVQESVTTPTVSQQSQPQQQSAPSQPTRQTSSQVTQTRSYGARTLGPTNSADTLWTIAAQVRPNNDVSMQQVMLAIQDLNPDAFINSNINRLKRGEILRVPDEGQIRSRSKARANQEVAVQNREFSAPTRTVDASGTATESATEEAATGGGDELRLVTADDASSRDPEDGGSAGGDGETAGGVDAGTAVAMEELESARRENEELTGRVDDLQNQVETLQRLLELKNSQLAEMQNTEQVGDAGSEVSEADEMADGSAVTGESDAASESGEMAAEQEMADGEMPEESMPEESMPEEGMAEEGTDESEMAEGSEGDAPAGEMAESADDSATGEEPEESSEPVVAEEPVEQEPADPVSEPVSTAPAEKPFPGNVIDAITNNFIYQVALGGGLIVLLLLLLLLARRNANREKAFYDQLNSEGEGDETDSFDLTFDEEDGDQASDDDPVAEADAYIAYGRLDQAAQTLETAISREPSRTDLRLKLLGVYADSQDRESFDKQFREVEALDDEDATAEAQAIQARLEEAESMPSIDDLESQLRSDGGDTSGYESEDTDDLSSDFESELPDDETDTAETGEEDLSESETSSDESDFEDMDLDLPDEEPKSSDADEKQDEEDSRDDMIEYDLSSLESSDDEESDADESLDYSLDEADLEQTSETDSDEDDLSFDFDTSELEDSDADETDLESLDVQSEDDDSSDLDLSDLESDLESDGPTEEAPTKSAESSDTDEIDIDGGDFDADSLDESFLDELDAELDKVADEDGSSSAEKSSELDDLELDVSDEDLALMEEFSESDDDTESEKASSDEPSEDASLEEELGLEDALQGDEPADPEQEVEGAEQADETLAEEKPELPEEDDADDSSVPVASPDNSGDGAEKDLDESDLGDDDDFDFLAGTDEAATKLDLARAYVEMGDVDGARDILEEVALEGNDEQKAEAQDLLKNLS
ncbi:FimV/HubP family polar landmark protein [Marinobacter sp. CHS3-4]|uniref:FimV/HubP family polar landmark protein n=1 Tax=Marinobacter sp. CHS3-4 TaxID=3045174 RepID=UPI0024B4898B|nr:FimV/HubP family polar landmark protein [Marinobacter sp. CHS3-4]MDI9245502.1 FimV/HubP family polar landmark protein [Marinobacter sp. CHS3-4]